MSRRGELSSPSDYCARRRLWLCMAVLACACVIGLTACSRINDQRRDELRSVTLREQFNEAYFCVLRGEFAHAAERFHIIYEGMKPTDDFAHRVVYFLGYSYEQLGENQAAIAKYEELIIHYPDSEHARDAQTRLAALKKAEDRKAENR